MGRAAPFRMCICHTQHPELLAWINFIRIHTHTDKYTFYIYISLPFSVFKQTFPSVNFLHSPFECEISIFGVSIDYSQYKYEWFSVLFPQTVCLYWSGCPRPGATLSFYNILCGRILNVIATVRWTTKSVAYVCV